MTTLAQYKYRAVDTQGKRRSGSIRAESEADATHRLTSAGLRPVAVASVGVRRTGVRTRTIVGPSQVAGLARELSVLLEAKIPIGRGMLAIADQESNPALRELLRDVATQIESGSPLTEALGRHRHAFGEVFIETVRAAERSGTLDAAMLHLADMLERQIESRQQLRRAMTYPTIVLTVVAAAVGVIVVFVVPRFGTTFAAQGMDLPIFTRIVQVVGESVRAFWWLYAGAVLACITGLVSSWKSEAGRLRIEKLLLRVPYVGRTTRAVTAARFARVMSLALGSGVDLIEAVQMSGRSTGRRSFAKECDGMATGLRRGDPIGQVLRSGSELPSFALRMIAAGKNSDELSKACAIVARHYDRESSHLTKNISTVIEPVLTVLMAAVVLIIALSVFLPMWQMVGLNR